MIEIIKPVGEVIKRLEEVISLNKSRKPTKTLTLDELRPIIESMWQAYIQDLETTFAVCKFFRKSDADSSNHTLSANL